jgi:hypothetical protein
LFAHLTSLPDLFENTLLGLTNPATDKRVSEQERRECIEAVYEAADGLPKSLNELGNQISRNGLGGKRISPADVRNIAQLIPISNLRKYRRTEFPEIIQCVESNPAVRIVLQCLYEEGIGRVQYWSDIIESAADSDYSEDQLDNAICELIDTNFLVRTGKNGEVLFAAK